MFGKYRSLLILQIMAIALVSSSAYCFELFPRPDGEPYTIQRGDTLFSLAERFYGNSHLWPFLWNQNPHIKLPDPNKPVEEQQISEGIKVDRYDMESRGSIYNQIHLPPTGVPEDIQFMFSKLRFTGIPYDKKYFRFKLTPRPTQVWGYIVSSPDDYKSQFLERDLIYIRFRPSKRQAILVGDRFGIYRERGPLHHPVNSETNIGFLSEVVGEVEIISTGHNLVTGVILESYLEIQRGDKISLFAPRPRDVVPSKTHRLLTGTILASAGQDASDAYNLNLENDIVFIDRGQCDGIAEGMLLNIYRPHGMVTDPHFDRFMPTPDKFLGEAIVLKAFDKNSTVLITLSREEIVPGDIIKSVSD
jgi:hypothetical protein